MAIVTSEINNAATATAQMQAAQPRSTGAASKLGSQDFLNLMMKQLQYQDPMEPTGNTEFIAQQAQFTQLTTSQEMNDNIKSNNSISQALSLVGKNVTLTDPDDKSKTITGNVTSATMKGANSTININGKDYALSYIKTVNGAATSTTGSTTNNSTTNSGSATTPTT